MAKPLASAIFVVAFCSAGCLHPRTGPNSLPRDRSAYSSSLSDSWKQETLLNIVKVRYLDPPVFVDVGSIVASYTLAQNASVGGTITPQGSSSAVLGGSVGLSSTPTITYTPLTGNAYINGLMTPLSPERLFRAIQNGMPADSVLFTTFMSINGLRNQSVSLQGIVGKANRLIGLPTTLVETRYNLALGLDLIDPRDHAPRIRRSEMTIRRKAI